MKSATQATITPEQQEKLNALLLEAAKNREGKVVDSEGLTQTVLGLLRQGADINAQGSHGKTALMFAASAKVANDLLTHPDVNINLVSSSVVGEFSALVWAAIGGNAEVVDALLKSEKFDVNESISGGGLTPLIAANNVDVIKVLARHHALDANKPDSDGRTAWTDISNIGDQEWRERKFTAIMNLPGIDVRSPNQFGDAPLLLAAHFGYAEIVKSLLANHEVDVNAVDSHGHTALIRVLSYNSEARAKPIVDAILESERVTNINAVNNQGATALRVAASEGRTTIVNQIITHTATSQKNDGQDWPVMIEQLNDPQIQNFLDRQTSSFLAVIMPEGGLRDSIITNFNGRNPDSPLNHQDPKGKIAKLKGLKNSLLNKFSRTTDSDGSQVNLSELETLANKTIYDLMTNPDMLRFAAAVFAERGEGLGELEQSVTNTKLKMPYLTPYQNGDLYSSLQELFQLPSPAPSEAVTGGSILPPRPPEKGRG